MTVAPPSQSFMVTTLTVQSQLNLYIPASPLSPIPATEAFLPTTCSTGALFVEK